MDVDQCSHMNPTTDCVIGKQASELDRASDTASRDRGTRQDIVKQRKPQIGQTHASYRHNNPQGFVWQNPTSHISTTRPRRGVKSPPAFICATILVNVDRWGGRSTSKICSLKRFCHAPSSVALRICHTEYVRALQNANPGAIRQFAPLSLSPNPLRHQADCHKTTPPNPARFNGGVYARRQARPPDNLLQRKPTFAGGHTASNAPDLFRPPKLTGTGPG